ncbi:MAG: FAD-dependent oxidoreductase [Deltaproteobacteria bacterium]|nr:FAD-dependent oxidoreductase [Deltaproteobacteria bacterium]
MVDQTDVVIIGGGCTGAGVARDLSMRNFQCVLLEMKGPVHGSNDRHRDLLHSGAFYVVADPVAARECYYESRILRRIAGHCIEETGGLSVLLPGDDPGYADRLLHALSQIGIPARRLPAGKVLEQESALAAEVREAIAVPEAVVNPFAMALANVRSAQEHGARVLTHCTAVSLMVEGGEVRGVRTQCRQSGEELEIRSRCIINAAGALVGEIATTAGINIPLLFSRETFVLMTGRLSNAVIYRCRAQGSDGDVVITGGSAAILGAIAESDRTAASPEEVDEIIEGGGQIVPGVLDARAIRAYSRIRPLLKLRRPPGSQSRGIAVLDHGMLNGVGGLYTVLGGGITTYRLAAQLVSDAVCRRLGSSALCTTHREVLPPIACRDDTVPDRKEEYEFQGISPLDLREILMPGDKGIHALKALLEERWEGVRPVAWGERLREEELIRGIAMETFNLDHVK